MKVRVFDPIVLLNVWKFEFLRQWFLFLQIQVVKVIVEPMFFIVVYSWSIYFFISFINSGSNGPSIFVGFYSNGSPITVLILNSSSLMGFFLVTLAIMSLNIYCISSIISFKISCFFNLTSKLEGPAILLSYDMVSIN